MTLALPHFCSTGFPETWFGYALHQYNGFQKFIKNTTSKNFHWMQWYLKTGICLCSNIAKHIPPSKIKVYFIIAK